MALSIYTLPDPASSISENGTFENPFSLTFDGRNGGVKQTKLYVRNGDSAFYYENIQLTVQDDSPSPIIDEPAEGFSWKLAVGDTQPTENDWINTSGATLVGLSDIGSSGNPDTSTYLPFWVYIQVPPGLDIQTFKDVKFILRADEVAI